MGGPIKRVSSPGPPPVLGEGLGPAGRAIPSDSKSRLWRDSLERAGFSRGFSAALRSRLPLRKGLDGPGRILSRRDSSSIALPPEPSW